MKKCEACGREYFETDAFCAVCGAALSETADTPESVQAPESVETPEAVEAPELIESSETLETVGEPEACVEEAEVIKAEVFGFTEDYIPPYSAVQSGNSPFANRKGKKAGKLWWKIMLAAVAVILAISLSLVGFVSTVMEYVNSEMSYTKGVIIDNCYSNEWADLSYDLGRVWVNGTSEEYDEQELDYSQSECGLYLRSDEYYDAELSVLFAGGVVGYTSEMYADEIADGYRLTEDKVYNEDGYDVTVSIPYVSDPIPFTVAENEYYRVDLTVNVDYGDHETLLYQSVCVRIVGMRAVLLVTVCDSSETTDLVLNGFQKYDDISTQD